MLYNQKQKVPYLHVSSIILLRPLRDCCMLHNIDCGDAAQHSADCSHINQRGPAARARSICSEGGNEFSRNKILGLLSSKTITGGAARLGRKEACIWMDMANEDVW